MHPNAIDLQAFACGDDASRVASHLGACDACTAYVARAGGFAKKSPRTQPVPTVTSIESFRRRPATRIALTLAPFAAAAAILLWMGTREPPARTTSGSSATSPTPTTPTTPPAALALNDIAQPGDPDTTFKGGMQLAVVRERNGAQERFTGAVQVRAGDRLRIEVALDRSQTILGAVMGEDGSYLEVMPAGARDAGTHFSEKSTRIDERPLRGTVLIGSPEAVRLARTTHDFTGLRTLPIEWDAAP
jgi:hypothetical protein